MHRVTLILTFLLSLMFSSPSYSEWTWVSEGVEGSEPLRLYRRLQILSGLEHEQIKTIFPGDTGAGCSDGLRT